MSISKFLTPEQLRAYSLIERLELGDIPDEATLADIAYLEYPHNERLRSLYQQALYAAAIQPNGPDRLLHEVRCYAPVLRTTHRLLRPTLLINGEPTEPVETVSARELEDLLERFQPAQKEPPPQKPDREPPPVWQTMPPSMYVKRDEYRRWRLQQELPLPAKWFPASPDSDAQKPRFVINNVPLAERQTFSADTRVKVGEIPDELFLVEIARMEYPDDHAACWLYLKVLFHATRETGPARLPVRMERSYSSGVNAEDFLATRDEDYDAIDLATDLGRIKSDETREAPPSPEPEELRMGRMLIVRRNDYRVWLEYQQRPLPKWWFPESEQINPPPAEPTNTASNESIAPETAAPYGGSASVDTVQSSSKKRKRTRNVSLKNAVRLALKVVDSPSIQKVTTHFNRNISSFDDIKEVNFKERTVTYITATQRKEKTVGFRQIGDYIKQIMDE